MSKKTIDEKDYIEQAKKLVNTSKSPVTAVRKLEVLDTPPKPSLLIQTMIAGWDGTLDFEEQNTYDTLDGKELENALTAVAEDILKAVKTHIANYEAGNKYQRQYKLVAKYLGRFRGYYHSKYVEEYVEAQNDKDAKEKAVVWRSDIPATLPDDAEGDSYKLEWTTAGYDIVDSKGEVYTRKTFRSPDDNDF